MIPHQDQGLDHLLPNLRLISGVMGRKSMTYLVYLCCRAEEWFARGRYLIKFRSYGVTNVRGRGRNGLTRLEIFVGHFIELLFWTIFSKDHWHFFSLLFFKKITPCPSMNLVFSEGDFEEILTLFEVDRHTVEILSWSCGEIDWVKVDDNTRSR